MMKGLLKALVMTIFKYQNDRTATRFYSSFKAISDTSSIVDFLTPDFGRVSAVVRGARGKKTKSSMWTLALEPFKPLLISAIGKNELLTLTSAEVEPIQYNLSASQLFSGFYLNEILYRLLPKADSHPLVFDIYVQTLEKLSGCNEQQLEPILRSFEKIFLEELGFGHDFLHDCRNGELINISENYLYIENEGFTSCSGVVFNSNESLIMKGEVLLAIANDDYSIVETRLAAKQLMRSIFSGLLGNKPLKSRELFK